MEKEELIINKIDDNLFELYWDTYGKNNPLNKAFIKKVFLKVDARYKKIIADASVKAALVKNVGIYDTINYICAEHKFHLALVKKDMIEAFENDENYFNQLTNIVLDKMVINEFDNVESRAVISKYSVEISVLEMYINKIFHLIGSLPIDNNNAKHRLETDIFAKCFLLLKSTLNQLCEGLETEAMSAWRTFHELFCVLCVIHKSNEDVSKAYYRHLRYGAYSRGEITNEKEIEEIQAMMEQDMLALEVKKANKEKFINYGWIHWAYKTYKDEEVKMNFLGGLQKVAEQTDYKKYYELSSDVTHSTPLLVYANKNFFTKTTLKITYESFFRIETLLLDFVNNTLKINTNEGPFADYLKFRTVYKPKVEIIYRMISSERKA